MSNILNIEFKVTNECNFRCTYCFEHGAFGTQEISKKDINKMLERIELLRNSEQFNKRFDGMKLTLWGGEPTLNRKTCAEILKYAEKNNAQVHMYSNGTGLRSLKDYIKSGLLNVQISYDGEPVNSIKRIDVNNKPSTNFVRKQIEFMIENDLPFRLKSTITPDCFIHMSDCWKDIYDIRQQCKTHKNSVNYCPTIDYYNIDSNCEEILKDQLLEIAKLEVKHFESNNRNFLLTWFNGDGDSFCSAGSNIIIIDLNGDIYPCHGCLYAEEQNKTELKWCSLYDSNFINIVTERIDLHNKIMYNVNDEYSDNYFTYNVKCNSESFNKSKKNTYDEKWVDYSIYKPLENYFKIVSKVTLALHNSMEKQYGNNKISKST